MCFLHSLHASASSRAQACMRDDYCATCEFQRGCVECTFVVKEDTICDDCSMPIHVMCATQGKCQQCFFLLKQRAPPVNDLGPMTSCQFCDCRQFSADRTFCCGAGEHVLPTPTTEVPHVLHDFIVENAELLIRKGRELNQLASMTAVGVHGRHGVHRGGIHDMHGGKAFASVQGRLYHYGLFSSAAR